MTKGEYLESVQKKADKTSSTFAKKSKIRKGIITTILCLGSIAICFFGMNRSAADIENKYTRFVENKASATIEHFGYKDTFDIWNARNIGNDVNCLLSGGMVLYRNAIVIGPSHKGQTAIWGDIGKQNQTIETGVSFINIWDGDVIYRDDTTRRVMSYDLKTGNTKILSTANAGEVLVSDGTVYYTDIVQGHNLYSMSLNGEDASMVVDKAVVSFAVIGDTVIYQAPDYVLHSYVMSSGEDTVLGQGVERFFLTGNIIMESGDKIFRADSEGRNPKLIYTAEDSSMRLVGATGRTVFIQEKGLLWALIDGEKKPIVNQEYVLYHSLTVKDDAITAVAYKDSGKEFVRCFLLFASLDNSGFFNEIEIVDLPAIEDTVGETAATEVKTENG